MKVVKILLVILIAVSLFACQSAQDKAAKSQQAVNEERLELIDKYKKCMKKAKGDTEKEASCDQYLKAAEALK